MTAVSAPAEPTPAQIAAGRRTLLLATGALMLPFVLGAGLYFSGWRPSQTGNRGELLHPPVPFPAAQFMGEGGQPLAPTDLAGKWTLVLAGRGACEAACTGRIDEMRRVQVSLNKEMGRLRRLVLSDDAAQPALAAARAAQPDLLVATRRDPWPAPFPAEPDYRLYVIDPQGNLMLRYAPDAPGQDVRKDLERLLKFAWTG